jgi:hypothetical protein
MHKAVRHAQEEADHEVAETQKRRRDRIQHEKLKAKCQAELQQTIHPHEYKLKSILNEYGKDLLFGMKGRREERQAKGRHALKQMERQSDCCIAQLMSRPVFLGIHVRHRHGRSNASRQRRATFIYDFSLSVRRWPTCQTSLLVLMGPMYSAL